MSDFETQPAKTKRGKSKLLVIVLAVVALGAGAAVGGKFLPFGKDKEKGQDQGQNNEAGKARAHGAAKAARSVMHLESFVVNLADGPGVYLRVGIDLGLAAAATEAEGGHGGGKDAKDGGRTAVVRDTILGVLMRVTAQEVATAEGKEKLKHELLGALQRRLPELGAVEVYYTDFLLQG